jgi:membrane-associated protease RseP (regulator of RpoE activity)
MPKLRAALGAVLFVAFPVLMPVAAVADPSVHEVAGEAQLQWYQPVLLPSLRDIATTLNNNHDFYAYWCKSVGYDVTTEAPGKASNWDNGGRIMCQDDMAHGTVATLALSSTRLDLQGANFSFVVSLDGKQINRVELYRFPSLDDRFPYAIKIALAPEGTTDTAYWLRTTNADVAHALADAVVSLAAANMIGKSPLRPSLGITFQIADVAAQFHKLGWTGTSGLLVFAALPGSPAAAAGIVKDDIIVEVDGKPAANVNDPAAIATAVLGDSAKASIALKLFRAGKTVVVNVDVVNPNLALDALRASLPASAAAPVTTAPAEAAPLHLGVTARVTHPEELKNGTTGVFIVAVVPGSVGEQMGLKQGDILVEIDGVAIPDMAAMKQALSHGKIERMKVLRASKPVTLEAVSQL